jgi:hypothetical protein
MHCGLQVGRETVANLCPSCGEMLTKWVDYCPTCGEALDEGQRKRVHPPGSRPFRKLQVDPVSGTAQCSECLTQVDPDDSYCWACGTRLVAIRPGEQPSSGDPETRVDTLPAGAWLALAGGLLMAVGSFLPWLQATVFVTTITRNGMQMGDNMGFSADGVITLVLGVITCVIGLSRLLHFSMPRFLYSSTVITGLIAGAITIYDATQVHKFVASIGNNSVTASMGYGLWVLLIGCALAILGGFVVRFAPKPTTQPVAVAKLDDEAISSMSATAVAPAMDAPAAASVPPTMSVADELSKLAALLDRGLLTADEFAAEKARLLVILR